MPLDNRSTFRPMYDGSSITSKQQTPENEVDSYDSLQLFKVIQGHRNWYQSKALLVLHRNFVPIFYRFPAITIYWSKNSVYPRQTPRHCYYIAFECGRPTRQQLSYRKQIARVSSAHNTSMASIGLIIHDLEI